MSELTYQNEHHEHEHQHNVIAWGKLRFFFFQLSEMGMSFKAIFAEIDIHKI